MNKNMQPNGHLGGEEKQEKIQTSQGLVLTGDALKKFNELAQECLEGYKKIKPILLELDEAERRKREEEKEKSTLEEICQLLRDNLTSSVLMLYGDLIELSGNINAKNNSGKTALMIAGNLGLTNIVDKLLKAGADIEARDNDGRTSLICTSFNGKTETVKLLLDRGAKVNERNNNGKTALGLAGNQEIRDLLISYGATE